MTETQQKPKGKISAFFGRVWGFIKRHKKLVIFLVVIAVIAAIVLNVLGGMRTAAAAFTQAPQTVTLARMDLQQIVSGTGSLQSSVTREVTSSLAYDIAAVHVEEGEQVRAGQLLATLDSTGLDKSIMDARKSIADAEESDALALAQAERKLQDAQNTRALNWDKNEAKVQEALKALEATPANYDAVADSKMAGTAEGMALTDAKNALAAYVQANGEDGSPAYNQLVQDVEMAQKAYTPKWEAEKTAAQNARESAQSAYNQAVETRDAAYRNDSISIENAQDSVDTQKLRDSAATYRTQLEGYLEDKDECQITAPVAGTVTAMAAQVGQSAGGSAMGSTGGTTALFTIEDTSSLEITASIPEYDAVIVKTGMQVSITTDAIDGAEWEGTVKSISPKATDTSGNFTVVVRVTSPVGQLAIGMSTKINIITKSKNDVFAVPYDAVTTNEAGESVVYLYGEGTPGTAGGGRPEGNMSGGASMPEGFTAPQGAAAGGDGEDAGPVGTPVVVQTGMETDYYIEIAAGGLKEGMLILADPEGKNVSVSSGFGGFPMGGGF